MRQFKKPSIKSPQGGHCSRNSPVSSLLFSLLQSFLSKERAQKVAFMNEEGCADLKMKKN